MVGRPLTISTRRHLSLREPAHRALSMLTETFDAVGPSEALRHGLLHLRNLLRLTERGLSVAAVGSGGEARPLSDLAEYRDADGASGEFRVHTTLTRDSDAILARASTALGLVATSDVAEVALRSYAALVEATTWGDRAVVLDGHGAEICAYAPWLDVEGLLAERAAPASRARARKKS